MNMAMGPMSSNETMATTAWSNTDPTMNCGTNVHCQSKHWAWAHAVVMTIAWIGCGTGALWIARFVDKRRNAWWFPTHITLAVSTVVLSLIGFMLILNFLDWEFNIDATDTHHVLGFFIIILSPIQLLMGYTAHKMWNPFRSHAPWFPDRLHWWFGRFLWLAAMWNIWIGINMGTLAEVGPTVGAWGQWVYIFMLVGVVSIFIFKKQPNVAHDESNPERPLLARTEEEPQGSGEATSVLEQENGSYRPNQSLAKTLSNANYQTAPAAYELQKIVGQKMGGGSDNCACGLECKCAKACGCDETCDCGERKKRKSGDSSDSMKSADDFQTPQTNT